MTALQSTFFSLLRNMTHITAQNKLMACTDREIAVALLYMDDVDKEYIFAFLAQSKEKRIKEEIRLLKKTRISDERYGKIVGRLIKHIKGDQGETRKKSYFRPKNKDR